MVNVRLPVDIRMLDSGCAESIERMAKMLVKDYNTFVPIFEHGGFLWARVSAQIYLELEDFTFLGHALKRICYQVVGSGEDDSGVSNILVRTVEEGSCI
jgi:PERQ amino acid-rich with GYF domain-containing protein